MKDKFRVLYAEDNPYDADLTLNHFAVNAPQFELEVVEDGKTCLARLDQRKYDLLLLDHHLPDLDGIDVLKELATRGLSLPVVMVTAVGDEALVVRVLRLGACDYVPKHRDYLQSLPEILASAITGYRRREEQQQSPEWQRRHILYVEHHPADIDLTLNHFAATAPHLSLEVVRSSKKAFALLPEGRFDLVLTDLRMPDMNAIDFIREAKHRGLLVPFIVITGKGDEAAAVAALKNRGIRLHC